MFPYTLEIRGRQEPIDAVKVAVADTETGKIYYLVTPDKRICSVLEQDILCYWENQPDEGQFENIDRLIREGEQFKQQTPQKYKGAEYQ